MRIWDITKRYSWAEPDVDAAAAYVRRLYEDLGYYQNLKEYGKKQIESVLGKERIVGMLENRLEKIAKKKYGISAGNA